MRFFLVAIFALVTSSFARPQAPPPVSAAVPVSAHLPAQPHDGSSTPATIISQSENVGPNGTFNYSYETSDGIKVEQTGSVIPNPEAKSVDPNNPDESADIQVVQGSYSYTAPDGQEISLKYVADDKGFQPEGAHLPTPPPVPESIARSLGQPEQAQAPQVLAARAQLPQAQPLAIQHPEAPQAQTTLAVQHPQEQTQPATGTTLNPSPVTHP